MNMTPTDGEKRAARRACLAHMERMEAAEPVAVEMGGLVDVAGRPYRVDYDVQTDLVTLIPDARWREVLAKVRTYSVAGERGDA